MRYNEYLVVAFLLVLFISGCAVIYSFLKSGTESNEEYEFTDPDSLTFETLDLTSATDEEKRAAVDRAIYETDYYSKKTSGDLAWPKIHLADGRVGIVVGTGWWNTFGYNTSGLPGQFLFQEYDDPMSGGWVDANDVVAIEFYSK